MKRNVSIVFLEIVPANILRLERLLRAALMKFSTIRALDGRSFEKAIRSSRPDVIIVKDGIKGCSALSAIRLSRVRWNGVPVIVIVDECSDRRIVRLMQTGAFDVISTDRMSFLGRIVRNAVKASRSIDPPSHARKFGRDYGARFKKLAAALPHALFEIDLAGTLTYIRDDALSSFGYTREDLKGGINVLLTIAPEDRSRAKRNIGMVMRGEIPLRNDYRIMRKDGAVIPVLIFSKPVTRKGSVVGLRGLILDVSGRKHTEQENRLLAQALSSAKDMISITDKDNQFIYVNQSFLDCYGYTKNEILGTSPKFLVAGTHGSATERHVHEKAMEGGFTVELVNRRKDGSEFSIALSTSKISDSEGRLIGIVGVAQDITERKQAAEAMRASSAFNEQLVQAIPFGIDIVDMQGNILYMSDRMKTLSGGNAIGQRCWSVYRDDKAQCLECPLILGLDSDRPSMLLVDGVLGGRMVEISHIKTEYLGTPAMLEVFQDVTDRMEAEEALRRGQKMESLGILAGGVAHDFNNLLVAMLGHTSLAMKRMEPDHPAYGNVVRAEQAAERASEITRQLLAYSGRGEFDVKPLNISALVQDNVPLLSVLVPKNVGIIQEHSSETMFIDADAGQIQQVIMNLFINAVEAIGSKPGTIVCKTWVEDSLDIGDGDWLTIDSAKVPGRFVILEIKDDGCGIAKDALSKIFDPFFSTKFTGRGLGLPAVLGVVKGHHGGLRVESEPGSGTTFHLAFPASASRDHRENGSQSAQQLKFSETAILVIDDEPSVREVVADILKEHHLKSFIAADGESGIELYLKHRSEIGLVVLDLSMPGLGGVQTCRLLKEINPNARIILSSGYAEDDASKQFSTLDIVGFIQKPYRWDELVNTLMKFSHDEANDVPVL